MKLSIILATLGKYLADVGAKGDAALYCTMWGCALPSLFIIVCYGSVLPWYFGVTLSALMLIAIGVFLARLTWPKVQDWILRSGNNFTAIHYLRDEYLQNQRLRDAMTLSHSERARLDTEGYKKLQLETERFRAMILDDAYPSHRTFVRLQHGRLRSSNDGVPEIFRSSVHTETHITFTLTTGAPKSRGKLSS